MTDTALIVTEEIPPRPFDVRLTHEEVIRLKRIRWQWYLLYNRVRNAPWNSATDSHLARCDEVIAIIDAALAADVTNH